ncbi:MAG: hypothetical protein H7099_03235 [Gemmatimonadaceae bacterium]|nr:hypothetical protein [Gemmatimonadaceae bacterium]
MIHTLRRVFGFLMVSAATAAAQRVPSATIPSTRICDMSMRVLIMQLVDSAGQPVSGATLTVRRVRTRQLVERAEPTGDGSYKILEDGALRDLRPGGESFDVTFALGARRRRTRVRIGMDEARCHVRFIAGPAKITL